MTYKILLVDDHAMFRAGLRSLLQHTIPEASLSEAGDCATAIEVAKEFAPELVIMDLHLPDQSGIEASKTILSENPSARIILLSGESDFSYVDLALQAGIRGYLLKTSAPGELPQAINTVRAGRLYLCPEANTEILENYRKKLVEPALPAKPVLSGREQEVLRFTAEGLRTKEIAARLELSIKTIETFRRRLMKKLNCSSTAELVRYAVREGLIRP